MEHDAGQGEQETAQRNGASPSATGAQERPEATPSQRLTRARAGMSSDGSADEALTGDDERPTVEHTAWIKQDDYWKRTTYAALTGRHSATVPLSRPLPRPKRFSEPTPVRSSLALLLILALIVLIPIGVVVAQRYAEAHIKLPTSIPGITQPQTATPAATKPVKPTATPKKK